MNRVFPFLLLAVAAFAQDAELTNYKSGIDVTWGGTKGVDYYEEYFYHDKLISDAKVVYIKSTTEISMAHNERNTAIYASTSGGRTIIGVNGLDGVPNSGDEGIIRYKLDRDRQYRYRWAQNWSNTEPYVLPAYTAPFTLASQEYETGVPVVGTTGPNGSSITDKSAYYYRGILDSVGDEWHVLSYADDDRAFLSLAIPISYEWSSDGKYVLLVVNPKTPCFTARATGAGQFYTTPPKAYFTPNVVSQTTYIDAGVGGTVTIELRDINGNNVFYRINGGSFTDAGAATVTLDQDDFSAGSNTLEYYYAGNAAYTKTRVVVKNPTHPSLAEDHGNYLWEDGAGLDVVKDRITRAPYLSTYTSYATRRDRSGQDVWDSWAGQGYRINPSAVGYLQGGSQAFINAFVALVEGTSYKLASSPKTYVEYAREMLLENSRTINPLGFELNQSADIIPSRELHYRGYYDANPVLGAVFAYDIIVANFRSDQIAGGLTPIEDYFVRDTLAGFAFEAMQWSAGVAYPTSDSPGMWGGARMMCAAHIGMIMPEYSTPYYGTSGFGTAQTTYPLCPYLDDELTWKAALVDETESRTAYPNYMWHTLLNDPYSLLLSENQVYFGIELPLGTWEVKTSYMSQGLFGLHITLWANMLKLHHGITYERVEDMFKRATSGNPANSNTANNPTAGELLGKNDMKGDITANGTTSVISASGSSVLYGNFSTTVTPGSLIYLGGGSNSLPLTTRTVVSVEPDLKTLVLDDTVPAGTGIYWAFGERVPLVYLMNDRYAVAAGNSQEWLQSFPTTSNLSPSKNMDMFAFALYDDTYFGSGGDTDPPTPDPSTFSVEPYLSGPNTVLATASEAVDAESPPVSYRFSVVTEGSPTSWGAWQSSQSLAATGLAANTTYDVQVQTRDSKGSATTPSGIYQVTTSAEPDYTAHRNWAYNRLLLK